MDERLYYLAFSNAPQIGPLRFSSLLKKFGTAQKIWESSEADFKEYGIGDTIFKKFDTFRKKFDFEKYQTNLSQKNIWFIAFCDKDYPKSLRKLENPPIVIYGKGDRACLKSNQTIGVVGTRKVTSYGKDVTESLVGQLANFGFTIISGMALGVDAIAHRSCLDAGGKTIAVLGNGVDLPFPRENLSLYKNIEQNGLIISEYPPNVNPTKGSFPARNRIISALSLGVLIPEAAEGSGSLITAEYAKKLEKPIFAVPGPITSSMSDGTSQLLQDGAILVRSANDIVKVLNVSPKSLKTKNKSKDFTSFNLSKDEVTICKILENENLSIDDIFRKTKIGIQKLSILLSEMEMKGIVRRENGRIIFTM